MLIAFVRGPSKPLTIDLDKLGDHGAGVRCPACHWRPRRSDLWSCNPGCGHAWHTFDTAGLCPGCDKHWAQTQCIKCGVWSDHDAWYHEDDPHPS